MGDVVRCPDCGSRTDMSIKCPRCKDECFMEEGYETIYRCKSKRCGYVFTIEKKKQE